MRDLQVLFGGNPVVEVHAVATAAFQVSMVGADADIVLVGRRRRVQSAVGSVLRCAYSWRTCGLLAGFRFGVRLRRSLGHPSYLLPNVRAVRMSNQCCRV